MKKTVIPKWRNLLLVQQGRGSLTIIIEMTTKVMRTTGLRTIREQDKRRKREKDPVLVEQWLSKDRVEFWGERDTTGE